MGLDDSAHEGSDVQLLQFRRAEHAYAETLVKIDVGRTDSTDYAKERDETPIAFVIDCFGQKYWTLNFKTRLLHHLSPECVVHGLSFFDGAPEPGPTSRVRNSFNVITVVKDELLIVGDDEQHRSQGTSSLREIAHHRE
jgi:hypothetical protein